MDEVRGEGHPESEQLRILRGVEAGEISVEEAVRLLGEVRAPEEAPPSGEQGPAWPGGEVRLVEAAEAELDPAAPGVLRLRGVNGQITLRATAGRQARLLVHTRVRGAAGPEEARHRGAVATIVGNTLEVGPRDPGRGYLPRVSVSIEAVLPAELDWSGLVASSNAAIEAEGLTCRGLELRTSNGTVRLIRCGGGDLGVATSNGQIEVDGGVFEGLRLATSNGAVRLRSCGGRNLQVSTSNGAIEARGIEAAGVRLSTSNGAIILGGGGAGDVAATTSNGRIEALDLAGRVDLRTSNAAIVVGLAAEGEAGAEVTATTSSGGIEVRLPDGLPVDIDATTSNGTFDTGAFGPDGPQPADKARGRLAWRSPGWEAASRRATLVLRTSSSGMRFVRA